MKKQKRYSLSEIKIGLLAVVNSLPDAVVYRVEEINGLGVRLSYNEGKQSGGWIDYSVLMTPPPFPVMWRKQRDPIGWIHLLETPKPHHFIKVEKSAGGDYFVTAYREGDSAGGEVVYRPTLATAKKLAQEWLQSGEWTDYLQ